MPRGLRFPLVLLLLCATLPSGEPDPGTLRIDADLVIEPNGDLHGPWRIDMCLREYASIKKAVVAPQRLLKLFRGARADFLSDPSTTCRFLDESSAAVLDLVERGAAQAAGGGEWELPVPRNAEFVTTKEEGGRVQAYFFLLNGRHLGRRSDGQLRVLCPPGSTRPSWDEAGRRLRYVVPEGTAEGEGVLRVEVQSRDRLMSALYKVFGQPEAFPDQWVARAIFRNEGTAPVRAVRARFRIEGHSEWSPETPPRDVAPGGTLVVPYYPLLAPTIAGLQSTTPTQLLVEWSYGGADAKRQGSENRVVGFLGGREFIVSGLDASESLGTFHDQRAGAALIAAWVSRDDPVVKEFAGMASRLAGGAGAQTGDEAAEEVVRACYNLMLLNRFAYKSPPYLVDPKVSFDEKLVQNVKFPRDVIRDKSGTCIDLAILQAAMYNALGLQPLIAWIEGHAFPIARTQDGTLIPVEATGLEGGMRIGTVGFDEARSFAQKELDDNDAKGKIILVDIVAEWNRGVANPELEPLPADSLARWGINEKGPAGGLMPEGVVPEAERSPYHGTWTGTIDAQVAEDGTTAPCPLTLQIEVDRDGGAKLFASLSAEMRDGGATVRVRVEEESFGEVQEGQLVFQGTAKRLIEEPDGAATEMPPGRGAAKIEGGKLIGSYGDDEHGFKRFELERN